ncbi:MAG: hypothetical protein HRT47_06910 [Candidatus Caenarcaniphilales bacterium]|nr:hypothetical protein [Candidatus Caenarcaniphilales bacterium]
MELYSPLFTENQVKNTERIAQILSPYTDLEQKIIHELISHHRELFTNDTKGDREFLNNLEYIVNATKNFEFSTENSNAISIVPTDSRAFTLSDKPEKIAEEKPIHILFHYLVLANNLIDTNIISDPVIKAEKDEYNFYNEYFPIKTSSKDVLTQYLKDRNPELLRLSKLMFFADRWTFARAPKDFFRFKENEIKGIDNGYDEAFDDYFISSLEEIVMPSSCNAQEKRIITIDSNQPEVIYGTGVVNSTFIQGTAENQDIKSPSSSNLIGKKLPNRIDVGLSGPVPVSESSRPGEFKIHASHINRGPASNFAIVITNPDPNRELKINIIEGGIFNEYYRSPNGVISTPYNHLGISSSGRSSVKEFNKLNPYSNPKPTSGSEGFSAAYIIENPGKRFGEIPDKLIVPPGGSRVLDSRDFIVGDQGIVDIRGKADGDFHASFLNMPRSVQSESAILNQFDLYKKNKTILPRFGNVFESLDATGNNYWRTAGFGQIFAITRAGDCHAERDITIYPKDIVSGIGSGHRHEKQGTNLASFLIGSDARDNQGGIESMAEGIAPFPKSTQVGANTRYLWKYDEHGNEMPSTTRYRQFNIADRNHGDYHAKYKFKLNVNNETGKEKQLELRVGPSGGYYDTIKENQTIFNGAVHIKVNNKVRKFNITFTKASGEVKIPFTIPNGRSTVEIITSSPANSTPAPRVDVIDPE